MISQKTAARIWECYREITAAEKLLDDMEKSERDYYNDIREGTLTDAFGRQRRLQLGVPSGEGAHTLFDVAPKLAESVIRAHIGDKQSELIAANEQARIELTVSQVYDYQKKGTDVLDSSHSSDTGS